METTDWKQMILNTRKQDRANKNRKKENIDHDLIAYGVSRSGKTETKQDLLKYIDRLERKYRGRKKENISEKIDKYLYG